MQEPNPAKTPESDGGDVVVPATMKVYVTLFENKYAVTPAFQAHEDIDIFLARLRKHDVRDSKDGTLFSPVKYAPYCRIFARQGFCKIAPGTAHERECTGGFHRKQDNVDSIHAMVLDVDKISTDDFWERYKPLNAYSLVYTTFSHTPEKLSARVVYPFSRPVSIDEYRDLWPYLVELTGNVADQSCKDASRMLYLPTAAPGTAPWVSERQGKLLDPSFYLKDAPSHKAKQRAHGNGRELPNVEVQQVFVQDARAKLATYQGKNVALATSILAGKPFCRQPNDPTGKPGDREREPRLKAVCDLVAFVCPGLQEDDFIALIEPSLKAVQAATADPAQGGDGKSAPDGCAYPCEHQARERYRKAVDHYQNTIRAERALADEVQAAVDELAGEARIAPPEPLPGANPPRPPRPPAEGIAQPDEDEDEVIAQFGERGKYTDEYLAEQERLLGYRAGDLGSQGKRWILIFGKACWLWVNGKYQQEIPKDNLHLSIDRDFYPAPISRFVPKANGEGFTKLKPHDFMEKHSTLARFHLAQLYAQQTRYDADTQTIYHATCPLRPLVPEYNEQIDKWLECLGGEDVDALKRWIAAVTLLYHPSAALVLTGKRSAGKTMLAHGLARLWRRTGPVKLDAVMGNFNGALRDCPLVEADESIPRDMMGRSRSQELRSFISADSRTLNVKHVLESQLEGCIRLIMSANNEDLLKFTENLTTEDIAAIAIRFLHVDVGPEAAQYLESIGSRKGTGQWVDGDLIAKHALWLRDQLTVTGEDGRLTLRDAGDRFIVEGSKKSFHRNLILKSKWTSACCEWLVGFMTEPNKLKSVERYFVLEPGQLFVNNKMLVEYWDVYVNAEDVPPVATMNMALRHLSDGLVDERMHVGKKSIFHKVNVDYLVAWSRDNQIGDSDLIARQVRTGCMTPKQRELGD